MTFRILLVDDQADIRKLIRLTLQHLDDAEVHEADNGGDGWRLAQDLKPDLMLLDVMMPGELDGYQVCAKVKGDPLLAGQTKVILLTARAQKEDEELGLEMGADDYLPKPFNPRELLARIHAVLRRKGGQPVGAPEAEEKIMNFGDCELNLATRILVRAGAPVALTTGEFALLRALVLHPRQPLSRDKLMELARGRDHEPFDRAIDVQISRLRKLIEPDSGKPRFIQTVWGHGYVFVPDGAVAAQ